MEATGDVLTPSAPRVEVEWEQSESINDIATALAKAQGEMPNAKKSADNPFFKSKYADLAEVSDSCRPHLSKNAIAVVQGLVSRGKKCGVRTMLVHSSGQWMACTALAMPKDEGPQSFGSVTTYLRRYSLAAMTGVATEDDDGEKAEGRDKSAKPPGANWGKPANESGRSAPKAPASPTTKTSTTPASTTTGPTPTSGRPQPEDSTHGTRDPADDGTPITPGTLEDLRFAATGKYPKGKDAKMWLKGLTGIDDPAALSEFEGQKALKVLGM